MSKDVSSLDSSGVFYSFPRVDSSSSDEEKSSDREQKTEQIARKHIKVSSDSDSRSTSSQSSLSDSDITIELGNLDVATNYLKKIFEDCAIKLKQETSKIKANLEELAQVSQNEGVSTDQLAQILKDFDSEIKTTYDSIIKESTETEEFIFYSLPAPFSLIKQNFTIESVFAQYGSQLISKYQNESYKIASLIHTKRCEKLIQQDEKLQELIKNVRKEVKTTQNPQRLSRREFAILPYTFTILPSRTDSIVLRHSHKNSSEETSKLIADIKHLSEGTVGKGGIKIVYKLSDIDSSNVYYVRAVVKEKNIAKAQGSILASSVKTFREHPNILVGDCMEYESKKDGEKRVVFIMPLLTSDLENLMSSAKLTMRIKAKIMLQLAQALQVVHGEGFAHLDIKPQNIFVDFDPAHPENIVIKLADFDSAIKLDLDQQLDDTPRGTVNFMSPEFARFARQSAPFGQKDVQKSDIFSLGAAYFEIWKQQQLINVSEMDKNECLEYMADLTSYDQMEPFDESDPFEKLIRGMINPDSEKRENIDTIVQKLKDLLADPNIEEIFMTDESI